MTELLLGCGYGREKKLSLEGRKEWAHLVTLDRSARCSPDILWDLNQHPWPLESNAFDEVHAYEVLEHLGRQGDYHRFFADFREIYRILKPDGLLFVSGPHPRSPWLWGDPSHTRVISLESVVFLDQSQYEAQQGASPMTDFRDIWEGDLRLAWHEERGDNLCFVLRAMK